ncbi:MAG: hypothetical protein KBC30_07690 [Planctomycetes bacterium]|nr:hypothetical protein [Planctomycetota bacterium]HPY75586.1 hypothetical protein [Planctomycetota bacterium]HQB01205.1 hypothetical protein [Planctomycetota bacterium]
MLLSILLLYSGFPTPEYFFSLINFTLGNLLRGITLGSYSGEESELALGKQMLLWGGKVALGKQMLLWGGKVALGK